MTFANPLKLDPTRTTVLRRAATAATKRAHKKLAVPIRERLGIFCRGGTSAGTIRSLSAWLSALVSRVLGSQARRAEVSGSVLDGYVRGLESAYRQVKNAGCKVQSRADFLASMASAAASKVELLSLQAIQEMEAGAERVVQEVTAAATAGSLSGLGCDALVADAQKRVAVASGRAEAAVRTAVIRAHAEGQLDGYAALGVESVGLAAEFVTAGDQRVCPRCEGYEGAVFFMSEARGMIPLHPGCRCSWYPRNPCGGKK